MSNIFKVSQSKVKLWRKCHFAAHLRYVEKLRRKRVPRPLMFGRLVHDMIEAYANGDDAFDKLAELTKKNGPMFRAEAEEYGEIVDDVRVIMTDYFEYWDKDKNSITYVRMNKKGAEHTFEVEIADGIIATGKIDAVVKTPNRLRWLAEHKSFGRMPNEDHRWRNLQGSIYIRIMEMLGLPPVDGTMWDYIWSKPPGRPQMLKGGGLSKKMLVTLPTRVRDVLKQHKLSSTDYKRLLQMGEQSRKSYFVRIFNPARKKVIDHIYADFVKTATDMADRLGHEKEMNIDRHCDWCEFEPICRALLQGSDVEFVKKKEFEKHVKETHDDPDFEA